MLHESFQSKGFIAHLPINTPKLRDSAAGSGPSLITSSGQPMVRISLQALSPHAADHMSAQSFKRWGGMLAYVNKDISSAVECAEGACRVHQMALHLSTQAFLFKEPVRADIRTHKQ